LTNFTKFSHMSLSLTSVHETVEGVFVFRYF